MIVWDLVYSLSEPDFGIWVQFFRVQTSPYVDISRYSNGHISVVREATVRWLGTYCVCWYDLDPIQSQGHWPSEVAKISALVIVGRPQQAMHAGSDDDRQPPCRAFLLVIICVLKISVIKCSHSYCHLTFTLLYCWTRCHYTISCQLLQSLYTKYMCNIEQLYGCIRK